MFKKITQFIKYNTFTTIIIAVAFVTVASAIAANEDVRDKVLGEEIIETQGVDNSLLLAADLEDFDLGMKITNVMEDAENYYIDYQFNTLGIQDNVWQEIFNQNQLVVSIEALEGGDLGLYIMEELGEVIDYQLAYLKEVQENEEEKGETLIVETTIYTGLIGLVLDTKTKELPGYELVVKPPVAEKNDTPQDDSTQSMEPTGDSSAPQPSGTMEPTDETADDYVKDSYYYEWLIGNCISNGGYWYDSTCNAEPEIIVPVCDSENLDLCVTQELCEGADLYWYDSNDDGNEVCNFEEPPLTPPDQGENPDDPEDTPVCDVDNLDLCIDQDLCEGAGLFWHGDVCNLEEEVIEDEEDEVVEEPTEKTDEEICLEMELFWYGGECHLEEEVIDEVPAPVVD